MKMKEAHKILLFWAPRLGSILFAAFLSMFALDVFGEGRGALETAGALLMHLIPAAVVLVLLAVAWRRPLLGALAFAVLGGFYLLMSPGRFHWSAYAAISGPLFLIAALFLLNWLYKER
jgi:hypothetical protein